MLAAVERISQLSPANDRLGRTQRAPVDFDSWIGWEPRQRAFIEACANYDRVLYGGAAGGGKSYGLRWLAVRDLMRMYRTHGVRGIRSGIFSETYPVLEDRQISKVRMEFPVWLGRLNEMRHEFKLHSRYGGGVICFRNLDNPRNYLSAEFGKVYFDEQTQVEEEKYDFICSRLRWAGIPAYEYMAAGGTNPGGIGHAWNKRRWIDGQLYDRERKKRYVFIPAKSLDNSHLPEGYYDSLKSLPDKLARAYADGDWTVFEGMYFTEWDNSIHVITPRQLPSQWIRFRAMDYGFAKPAAVGWFAVNPWAQQLIMYRELYGPGMGKGEIADRIKAMTPAGEQIAYTRCDPACWINDDGDPSVAETLINHGVYVEPANNARVNGWFTVREFLRPFEYVADNEGTIKRSARLLFFSNCINTIRTLPSMVHDDHRPEDVNSDGEDHCSDMVRYGCVSRPEYDLSNLESELKAYHERRRLEGLVQNFPRLRERQANGNRSTGLPGRVN